MLSLEAMSRLRRIEAERICREYDEVVQLLRADIARLEEENRSLRKRDRE